MNDADWTIFLDTLTPDDRRFAQSIMARVQTILNSDRNKVFDRLQHGDKRSDHNAERINGLDMRLDAYEEAQANHVAAELERFAKDRMPRHELDKMLQVVYNLSARVERLEDQRQVNGDVE